MAWVYLILAGIFEIGWPIGLKLAQGQAYRTSGIAIAIICIAISGTLLWMAQKEISIGTSYAVWTGIGATGTFMVGILFFGDAATLLRFLGVSLILFGVVLLKVA